MPVATSICSLIQPDPIIDPLRFPVSGPTSAMRSTMFSYSGNSPSSPFPLPQVVGVDLTFPQSCQCDSRRLDRVHLTGPEYQDHMQLAIIGETVLLCDTLLTICHILIF